MTHVSELFDPELFQDDFREGYIREQRHPTLPLRIYNYTEKAVYERHWTLATLQCRGLILDMSGNVVARPFPKFFNHGEEADPYTHSKDVWLFDKLDGSLGIGYHRPEGTTALATRGSFTSDQAHQGTEMLGDWSWDPAYTPLFEIIYPENRIVLDYHGASKLVLLGAVEIATGTIYCADEAWRILDWAGEHAEELRSMDLTRPNREGVVVFHMRSNTLEKFKQEDYLALHKLVTNLNARTIYDAMSAGGCTDEIAPPFPDEFHDWIKDIGIQLNTEHHYQMTRVQVTYESLVRYLDLHYPNWSRRDFASVVNSNYPGLRAELFLTLDDNKEKLSDHVWRGLRPSSDWRP